MKLKVAKINVKKVSNTFLPVKKFFLKMSEKIREKTGQKKINFSGKFFSFFKSRVFINSIISILFVLGIIEVIFAVMIYGFKLDNKATRLAIKIIPYPVAIVNQDFITFGQYQGEKDYIHHFYSATEQADLDLASIDKEILNQSIENEMIAFQAFRYRIKVNQSDVDTSINQIIDQNGGAEKLDKALAELYGLNLKQFEKLVRTQLLREKVSNELILKVKVSHILIRVDKDAATDKVDAAKAKIDGIKKQIDDGADFAESAKKSSEDTGSAEAGGSLDPFTQGEMVQEFADAAFSTAVGKISDPVRTEFGWHIIKVENKTGKINTSFNDWLAGIKDKSLILKLI